ncbi:hypothetical protein EC9_27280 [Rosistilla ulvae]|uniref:Uncharacterized protein n=1 Tax=Rosistilla ulvae TaxID=1930277 RepID=A0A517M0Y2_9BACT|nr:DUF1501 domain-containing protein [Rosistilla ulvae]QDS88537.1 hypothetical protein EC9_27280 [Rosistilla ulvae]
MNSPSHVRMVCPIARFRRAATHAFRGGFGIVANCLQGMMLHRLGFDIQRLTARFAGRVFRLTDLHGEVVREIIA